MSYGQNGGSGAFDLVAGVVTSGILAAFLFPLVFDQLKAVELAQHSGGVAALWDLFPKIMILVVFLCFVALALRAGNV
jgi:hypothetical protein